MDDCLKDIEIVHLKITTRFSSSTTILWSEKRIKWWSHGQVILIIGTALVASSITAYGTVSLALQAFMYVYIEAVNNVSVLHFCNGLLILRNYFKWTSYQLEILTCTITSDLSDISTIHAQLISIAQKWNRAFSFQLLLMVGHAFAILTTSIVKVYDEFVDFGYSDITSKVLLVFRELRDEFLQIVVIIFLVVSSDSTARMANNFSVALHSSLTWMTVCRKEISLISLQLLSNKLKFAAGNIIPIDFSLFFVIIGGVCTYVIYFFQNKNWDEVVIKY